MLGSFSRARLRVYEAMGGKSHDMSFCVEVELRQWNSSTANKTYSQDVAFVQMFETLMKYVLIVGVARYFHGLLS